MNRSERIRSRVAKFYGEIITGSTGVGVSNLNPGKLREYRTDDLAGAPDAMLESSFGCGNPIAFAGVGPGETVLDLGCGAGLDLLLAAERVGAAGRVIGVDMAEAMLARAGANIAQAGLTNVELRMGIIESLPVESNSVDWVISNCVINLSPEKDQVFAEIARVLKPGGAMLVSDIVTHDMPWWGKRGTYLYSACVAGTLSESDYVAGLRRAGLVEAKVRERLLYDPVQMAGLIEQVLPRAITNLRCCGKPAVRMLTARLSTRVVKHIWSAKLFARKPAHGAACG